MAEMEENSSKTEAVISLDLSHEPIEYRYSPYVEQKPYDPRPHEDAARRRIAYILLGLLGIVVVWALIAITFVLPTIETTDETKIKYVTDVLQIILGPIIALVSAATGFYFGSKPSSSNPST